MRTRAGGHDLLQHVAGSFCGQYDHNRPVVLLRGAEVAEHFNSAATRQSQVQKNRGITATLKYGYGGVAVVDGVDGEPFLLEYKLQETGDVSFILHDENAGRWLWGHRFSMT